MTQIDQRVQMIWGLKTHDQKISIISTFHEKNQGFDHFEPPFFGLKCAAMWRNCTESASQEGNIDKKRKKGFTSSMQEACCVLSGLSYDKLPDHGASAERLGLRLELLTAPRL